MKYSTNIQKNLTACFGDSITKGQPGVTYIKYLDKKIYKNYGLGGDNLDGMARRIEKYINCSTCSNFVLEIGANDIFLPFLLSYSVAWRKRIEARSTFSINDPVQFGIRYKKLLDRLYNKNITIVSIPCLGEHVHSELNNRVDEYNAVIWDMCKIKGIKYIDFNSWQKENIKEKSKFSFISKKPNDVLWDIFITTFFDLSIGLSKKRNLDTTIDGIHLNSKSASCLAYLIEEDY